MHEEIIEEIDEHKPIPLFKLTLFIMNAIKELESRHPSGSTEDMIVQYVIEKKIKMSWMDIHFILEKLHHEGLIYTPKMGRYRTV